MPKESLRPRVAATALTRATFSATCAGGSPQVRYLSTVSTATSMPASDDPPKYSGGGGGGTRGKRRGAAPRRVGRPPQFTGFPARRARETGREPPGSPAGAPGAGG